MDTSRLQQMGLAVSESDAGLGPEVELVLGVPLTNPLTRASIDRVKLTVSGERLIAIDPPELVGLAPLMLAGVTVSGQLEEQLNQSYNEHLHHLQRRSEELQSLGLAPHVNPNTLQLGTEVMLGDLSFALVADKRGKFRVSRATRGGQPLEGSFGQVFELSEFRERQALAGYLQALVIDDAGDSGASGAGTRKAEPREREVFYDELLERFGKGTRVPPLSAVECLMVLQVRGIPYRFAAARVSGRTFRGLLAGPQGKVWAERFELEDFPGVRELVAASLHVPVGAVEVAVAVGMGPASAQDPGA